MHVNAGAAKATGDAAGVQRLTFGLGSSRLAVDVAEPAAAHVLSAAYAPLRCDETRPAEHAASIERLPSGRLQVRFDRCELPLSSGSGEANPMIGAYYAGRETFARFAATQRGTVALYGTLVARAGAAMLLLGPTAIGKTVLALHLAQQGAKFLGDETVLLDLRSGTVRALPRKPVLRDSALPVLPAEMRDSVASAPNVCETDRGRLWYALDERDLGGVAPDGGAFKLRAICAIVERSSCVSLRRSDPAALLEHVKRRSYARPAELSVTSALRRILRGSACCEVVLGDPADTASALLNEGALCA